MSTSSPHNGVDPYGSAHDLPSMVEMKQQLRAFRWLSLVLAPKQRGELRKLERELSSMLDRVDAFYSLLGERNWIFTDHLPLSEVEALVGEEDDAARAEARLIEIIADRIRSEFWHIGLQAHEALRARRSQLERARQHYINEEWSSSTLQLIAVMDGFVNDVEPATRKGLHARTVEEMSSWDSLSNHHSGIASVLPGFQRTFKKRVDDEVFELHRHGIVHGSIVNFDNQVVATKAWNMLSAVADWATARAKEIPDSSDQPTWGDVWKGLAELAERKRARESFERYELTSDDPEFGSHPLVEAATSFLDAWRRSQWALVAQYMPPTVFRSAVSTGARAKRAKDEYGSQPIGEFELTSIQVDTAGGASVLGRASLGDYAGPISMQWILMDADDEHAVVEGDDTRWKLGVYPAHCFMPKDAA